MNKRIRFSVIIPIYNCSERLHVGVESIINQSFKDWELILINDGSTDDSLEKCNKYADVDSRIKVIDQINSGAGPARNHGIDVSKGEYLIFCDADDYYNKEALEKFDKSINNSLADLVIASYCEFKYNDTGQIVILHEKMIESKSVHGINEVRRQYFNYRKQGLITAPWGKAYRRDIIIKNNVQFSNLRRCQDVVFNLIFYEYIENLEIIHDILYNYQTPDGDVYIHKFPINMFEINKEVYSMSKDILKRWGVFDQQTEKILNTGFLKDASVLLRLNYQNNWNLNNDKKILLVNKILNDPVTINACITIPDKIIDKIIRYVIKSRNIYLCNYFSWLTLFYQNTIK